MPRALDPFRFLIAVAGWMNQHQLLAVDYREENQFSRKQLGGRRLRFTDDQRRLATKTKGLKELLAEFATIVTPETLPAWHRKLIAQKTTAVAGAGARAQPTAKR
jgi:hypothetical protein